MICIVGVKVDRPVIVVSNLPSARFSRVVALTGKEAP
jgi:hypothetical protein